jgi:hypothetical protein
VNAHVADNITFLFRKLINKVSYITYILVIQKLAGSRFITTFSR